MSTKREGVPCYESAEDDEPMFVLLARDEFAADIVVEWARRANYRGVSRAKIDEALEVAAAMRAWPTKKLPD